MNAGNYIWGGFETVGSLRSLGMSGEMSEVMFDPTVPWSIPFTQYGVKTGADQDQLGYTVLPSETTSATEPSTATPSTAAVATSPYSSMFGNYGGGSGSSLCGSFSTIDPARYGIDWPRSSLWAGKETLRDENRVVSRSYLAVTKI